MAQHTENLSEIGKDEIEEYNIQEESEEENENENKSIEENEEERENKSIENDEETIENLKEEVVYAKFSAMNAWTCAANIADRYLKSKFTNGLICVGFVCAVYLSVLTGIKLGKYF